MSGFKSRTFQSIDLEEYGTSSEHEVVKGAEATLSPTEISSKMFSRPLSHAEFCSFFSTLTTIYSVMVGIDKIVDLKGNKVPAQRSRDRLVHVLQNPLKIENYDHHSPDRNRDS